MKRKLTMLLASLFLVMGTAWAQTAALADGIYTIQADENGKRGYLAAGKDTNGNAYDRPVLVEISWGDYTSNSATPLDENSKFWYVTTKDGVSYLYNISKGQFIFDTGAAEIYFANPFGLNITQYNNYIHVGSGAGTRYLSMGCGTKAPGQVKWETTNANDGGCLLTFNRVEGKDSEFASQIAAANVRIESSKIDYTKFYRVYNKITSDETDMAWVPNANADKGELAAYNKTDRNQVWQFVPGTGSHEGKYLIYNLETKKYLRGVDGSNGVALTANISDAVYYSVALHASELKYKFFHSTTNTHHLYNDGGGKLNGWTAEDKEYFTLEVATDVPAIEIVYNFKYNGALKYTQKSIVESGTNYPDYITEFPYGIVAEAKPEGTVSEKTTKDIALTISLPFVCAKSYDDIEKYGTWYYMTIRDSDPTYMYYDPSLECIRATEGTVPADKKDAYTWGFVGNPFDGISIVNRAAGSTMILSSPTAPTGNQNTNELPRMVVAADATGNKAWDIMKPTHYDKNPAPVAGSFYVQHPTAKAYAFNRQDPSNIKTVCYWTGRDTGSDLQVISRGVEDLSKLTNEGVYALQAERAPLLYRAGAATGSKLSSNYGVSNIPTDVNDVNQQFLILRTENTPEGSYYLYSIAAGKYVSADLTFTNFPSPVLSFKENTETGADAKKALYPWWVKINDKFVVPGSGGQAGENKVHHADNPENDEGKRFRIVSVGKGDMGTIAGLIAEIGVVESMIQDANQLGNTKVYTVSTYDRGSWYYKDGVNNLWSTGKDNVEDDSNSKEQQFAFLTVSGHTYLYSMGASKFVVKSGDNTVYSEEPTQTVTFLKSEGDPYFPLVVAFVNGNDTHQIAISNGYDIPVISHDNNLSDPGNRVKIQEAKITDEGISELNAAVAKIETYLTRQELIPQLQALIDKAKSLIENILATDDNNATLLAEAKTAAENLLKAESYSADQLNEQIIALTAAINNAIYVTQADGFNNNYVYTFVTLRGWVGADDNSNYLIGTVNSKVDPAPTPSADNAMFQWAVYKSKNNHYYMYNIGKGMFMTGTPNGEPIPFVATPTGQNLTFKRHGNSNEKWADYPIMFSPDGGKGAVSQNSNAGLFYWSGSWNTTNDDGSNHKVTVVGKIAANTLKTIADAVELYETQGAAIQALESAIAAAQAKIDGMGEGLGYYSSTADNAAVTLGAIIEFKNGITSTTTVADIESKTTEANNLVTTFTLNVPEDGKFYRFKHPSEDAYMLSDATTVNSKKRLAMGSLEGNEIKSVFYYKDGTLLSYAIGQYLSGATKSPDTDWTCIAVGADAPTATFGAGSALGTLGFYLGGDNTRAYFSGRKTYVDAGGSFGSAEGYNWAVEEVKSLPVAVTSAGWATLYAPVALTIPTDESLKVYTAAIANGYVNLTEIKDGVIPAETGVMINAAAGTYNFAITTTDYNLTSSFVGSFAKSVKKADKKVYTLQAPENKEVGFYRFKGYTDETNQEGTKTYINGFRAWVELPQDTQAEALGIRFAGATTDIENSEFRTQSSELIYDLQGRRVMNPTKGTYIVGGKKVVIK